METKFTLQNIQSLRWLAAALVFMQHAVFFSGQTIGESMMAFRTFNFGGIGVYIFFIISGFVIALQTEKSCLQFLMHRAFRIYPTYLITIALAFIVFYLFSNHKPTIDDFSASMFLVPTGTLNSTLQIPYWTLIYEIFFYCLILFLMVLFNKKQVLIDVSILAWLAAIIVATQTGTSINVNAPSLQEILFSPLNSYFICGFFLSRVLMSNNHKIAFCGLMILAVSGCLFVAMRYPTAICAMGIGAIVFSIKSKPFPKLINNLGDYSYGIYLLHLPIIYCLFLALKGPDANFSLSLFTMLIVALPLSIAFGMLEHWIYKNHIRPAVDRFVAQRAGSILKMS